ncbi:MAG: hypothetical protein ACI9EF_003969 [Pseudohongiellaceae bacterium]|jgi:hypothetical protein
MKESHWRVVSVVLTTTLIIVVASWAQAQSRGAKTAANDDPASMTTRARGNVLIERNLSRYTLKVGFARSTEQDKYILYDTWNVAETKDIWYLEDPHKVRSTWKRIPFDKK